MKKSILKASLKWAGIAIVCFFSVALLLAFFLLSSQPGENYLRGVLEQQLEQALNHEVRIGALETNLVSRLQVWNAVLYLKNMPEKTAFVRIPHARIDYRLWDIFTGKLSIESVAVDSMTVTVIRDSTGAFALPVTGKTREQGIPEKPPLLHVHLGTIAVNNAVLTYHDRYIPLDGMLRNIMLVLGEETGGYRFQIQASSGNLEYRASPVSVTDLNMAGNIRNQVLDIDNLSFRFPGLDIAAAGSVDFEKSPASLKGDIQIKGKPELFVSVFHDLIPSHLTPLDGRFDVRFGLLGTLDEPHITVQADFADFRAADLVLHRGMLRSTFYHETITVDSLSMNLMGGSISGSGSIMMDEKLSHHVTLSVHKINLADGWYHLYHESSPFHGFINGRIESDGPLLKPEELQVSAHVDLQKATYRSKSIADINSYLSYKNGLVNGELRQADSGIKIAVHLKDNVVNGTFSAHILNLEPLAGLIDIPGLEGAFDASGTVSGGLANPDITADFSGKGIRYNHYPADIINGSISRKNGQIRMDRIMFSGSVSTVDSLYLPEYLHYVRGGVSYTVHLNGSVDNLEGEITARLLQPGYEDFQCDSGEVKLTVGNHHAHLHSLRLERDSLLVQLTGDYEIQSTRGNITLSFLKKPDAFPKNGGKRSRLLPQADLSGSGYKESGTIIINFDLSDSNAMKIDAKGDSLFLHDMVSLYPDLPDMAGNLRFNLAFTGSLENPSGSLDFFIESPRYELVSLDSIRGNLRVRQGMLYADTLEVFVNKQKTWAHGEIGLTRSAKGFYTVSDQSDVRCSAEGKNITVQILKYFIPPEMYFDGFSSYRLECKGQLAKPRISGDFNIMNAELHINPKTPPIKGINARASFRDSVLFIDHISGSINELPFRLQGQIDSADWQQFQTRMRLTVSDLDVLDGTGLLKKDSLLLDFNLKGFDLSLLQAFTPGLEQLKGTAHSRIHIDGLYADPDIRGTVLINDLGFKPPVLNALFTQGFISMNFYKNNVSLDSLFIRLNEGSIHAGGTAGYKKGEITHIDMRASIDDVKLNRPKEYSLTVRSGQLTCRNQDGYYQIDGTVVLGETRLQYGFGPKDILSFTQKVERPAQEPGLFKQRVRMNIQIRESKDIWVDNNLARLRLHPELSFIGNLAHPNVTGRLTVDDGYILYLDRKFDVKHGVIDFIDPDRLNPVVDFQAESDIKTYQTLGKIPYVVTLAITGPLDHAQVDLTSNPPLDKPDIIALLTLGATRDQLTIRKSGGSDVSINDILKERAEMLSSRKISNYVSRRLGNIFGLEDISIEGNLFNIGRSSGPQIFASEKITNKMSINYTTAVGHSNEQSIRLDYRLSKYFSFEGQTDQRGQSGIDAKYRIKFK